MDTLEEYKPQMDVWKSTSLSVSSIEKEIIYLQLKNKKERIFCRKINVSSEKTSAYLLRIKLKRIWARARIFWRKKCLFWWNGCASHELTRKVGIFWINDNHNDNWDRDWLGHVSLEKKDPSFEKKEARFILRVILKSNRSASVSSRIRAHQ